MSPLTKEYSLSSQEPLSAVIVDPARMRPCTTDRAPSDIAANAIILPTNRLDTPIVALDPVAQITLTGCAPFVKVTIERNPVVRVVVAWKTNNESGSPCPSNVRVVIVVIESVPKQYTPAVRVFAPRSPVSRRQGEGPALHKGSLAPGHKPLCCATSCAVL